MKYVTDESREISQIIELSSLIFFLKTLKSPNLEIQKFCCKALFIIVTFLTCCTLNMICSINTFQ